MIEYWKNLDLRDLFYINGEGLVCCEEWRDIPEWENYFKISNLGRCKSLERVVVMKNGVKQTVKERILTHTINKKGYSRVCFSFKNKGYHYSVHRLVAICFLENPLNLPEVNHKGEKPNKQDNTFWMLEWTTGEDNRRHRSLNEKSTSKYVGVHYNKAKKKWASEIKHNKTKVRFGYFETELEAYIARYNYEIENGIRNTYRQEP
jgi:hypothetical protein